MLHSLGMRDEDVKLSPLAGPTQAAAAMFTPASLIAAATRASAPGVFSMSMTRSTAMCPVLSSAYLREGSRRRAYALSDELTTDPGGPYMPMLELTYPKGAIGSDAREELLEELATKMLEAEKAPDTEFFRSITWVYANEIEPENARGRRPPRRRAAVPRPGHGARRGAL